jgi:hypothetical protein
MTLCNRVLDQRVSRLSFGLQYLDADTGYPLSRPDPLPPLDDIAVASLQAIPTTFYAYAAPATAWRPPP